MIGTSHNVYNFDALFKKQISQLKQIIINQMA